MRFEPLLCALSWSDHEVRVPGAIALAHPAGAVTSLKGLVSSNGLRLRSARIAGPDGQMRQPVSMVRQLARGDPDRRHDVRPVPAVVLSR